MDKRLKCIRLTMARILEESVFSGVHQCIYKVKEDYQFLMDEKWILGTVWKVIALCLAVWITIKHFRELQRPSTGWTVKDCVNENSRAALCSVVRDLNVII